MPGEQEPPWKPGHSHDLRSKACMYQTAVQRGVAELAGACRGAAIKGWVQGATLIFRHPRDCRACTPIVPSKG